MTHLQDRVVVITGAGRGIGRAHALLFAAQGAKVVVNDLGGNWDGEGADTGPAHDVVAEIVAAGGTAVADTHDIADAAEGVVQTALDEFGRIDCLVNNAGVIGHGRIDTLTVEQLTRGIDILLTGCWRAAKAAWGPMKAQRYGRIVNTSSAAAFGVANAIFYQTSKAGLIGLTRGLAKDGEADDIKVNAIMPLGRSRMADSQPGLSEFFEKNLPARLISPFVGALLSPGVPVTGETFAVGGGRAARVFLGTVPGLVGFSTIDEVLAGFDQVMAAPSYLAPTSMDEEIGYEWDQLGIDLSELSVNLGELGADAP